MLLANTMQVLEGRALLLWLLPIGFYASAAVGWRRVRKTKTVGFFSATLSLFAWPMSLSCGA